MAVHRSKPAQHCEMIQHWRIFYWETRYRKQNLFLFLHCWYNDAGGWNLFSWETITRLAKIWKPWLVIAFCQNHQKASETMVLTKLSGNISVSAPEGYTFLSKNRQLRERHVSNALQPMLSRGQRTEDRGLASFYLSSERNAWLFRLRTCIVSVSSQ